MAREQDVNDRISQYYGDASDSVADMLKSLGEGLDGDETLKSDLQTGAKYGMVTLDACLTEHYKNGLISYDELITKSQDPDTVVAKLKEEMGRG